MCFYVYALILFGWRCWKLHQATKPSDFGMLRQKSTTWTSSDNTKIQKFAPLSTRISLFLGFTLSWARIEPSINKNCKSGVKNLM